MPRKTLGWIGAGIGIMLSLGGPAFGISDDNDEPPSPKASQPQWIIMGLGTAAWMVAGITRTIDIRHAKGPRERAIVLRFAVLAWLVVMAFIGGMFLVPESHLSYLWIPGAPVLVLFELFANVLQARIRTKECAINTDPR